MLKPIARATGFVALLGMLLSGFVVPQVAALPPSTAEPTPLVPAVEVTHIEAVPLVVSKSGRYVVQVVAGRLELRDLAKDKRVKRFPATAQASSVSISDDGRYVTYTVLGRGKVWVRTRRDVRVYDRRTGRTRSAATTKSGKALQPKWRTTCVGDFDYPGATSATVCDEGIPLTAAPQLDGGQISGNGRYIAFCANYIRPDRIDLYIKDWRTKSLQRITRGCSYARWPDPPEERILPPMVSEDGRVILLPGWRGESEDSAGCWEPSHALIRRRELIEVGGRSVSMTHDGQLISSVGLPTGCDDGSAAAHAVWWFDLATRTSRPADQPGLRLTMANASRHGRYVAWFEYGDQPMDPATGRYPGERWLIWDRTAGKYFDLGPALRAVGYQPGVGDPLMTGDGRTVFLDSDHGAVAVRWSPAG